MVGFTVVDQDVPVSLASLDLDDNGDKVIFRQFEGKSLLRTFEEWLHDHPCRSI